MYFFLILCSTACIYGKDPPVTLIVSTLNVDINLVIQNGFFILQNNWQILKKSQPGRGFMEWH